MGFREKPRVDASDPESWLKGADGRLILEDDADDDVVTAMPMHDRVPIRPFSRPGRMIQRITMKWWLGMIGTSMTTTMIVCLLTGFHLLAENAPILPLSVQMSLFGALGVAGARNARRPGLLPDGAWTRRLSLLLETGGWLTIVTGPVLIALSASGTLR